MNEKKESDNKSAKNPSEPKVMEDALSTLRKGKEKENECK